MNVNVNFGRVPSNQLPGNNEKHPSRNSPKEECAHREGNPEERHKRTEFSVKTDETYLEEEERKKQHGKETVKETSNIEGASGLSQTVHEIDANPGYPNEVGEKKVSGDTMESKDKTGMGARLFSLSKDLHGEKKLEKGQDNETDGYIRLGKWIHNQPSLLFISDTFAFSKSLQQ